MDDGPHRNTTSRENVDYLSYNFDEMDLAVSWRILTRQKMNVANGIRLENASWRSWNKQRNHLKTVNPQTVNWLKDNDVTWLYGPLHTVISNMKDDDRNIMNECNGSSSKEYSKPLRPALKKLTESDILKRSVSELMMFNNDSLNTSIDHHSSHEFSSEVIANHRQPKLRFNPCVEQCVALSDEEQIRIYNRNKRRHEVRLKKYAGNHYLDDEDYEASDESSSEEDDNSAIHTAQSKSRIHSSIRIIEPSFLKSTSISDTNSSDIDTNQKNNTYSVSSTVINKSMDNSVHLNDHYGTIIHDIKEQPFNRYKEDDNNTADAYKSLNRPAPDKHKSDRPQLERSVTDINILDTIHSKSNNSVNIQSTEKTPSKNHRSSLLSHISRWLISYIRHKKT